MHHRTHQRNWNLCKHACTKDFFLCAKKQTNNYHFRTSRTSISCYPHMEGKNKLTIPMSKCIYDTHMHTTPVTPSYSTIYKFKTWPSLHLELYSLSETIWKCLPNIACDLVMPHVGKLCLKNRSVLRMEGAVCTYNLKHFNLN